MLLKSQGKKTLSRSFQKVRTNKSALSLFGCAALFFCGLGFVLVNRHHSYDHLKGVLLDISSVTLAAVESPVLLLTDVKKTLSYYDTVKTNAELTEELRQTNKNLQNTINTLTFRLNDLQGILDIHDNAPEEATTVSCFGQHSSTHTGFIFIHGGQQQKITRNSPVFGQGVLIGLIDKVGKNTSRVMLLSHQKSRIPIVSETSKIEGILCGTLSGNITNSFGDRQLTKQKPSQLTIQFINHPEDFKVGESIFTSGTDGIIPRGLLIGKVTKISLDSVYVEPATAPQTLKFLKVHKSSPLLFHSKLSETADSANNHDRQNAQSKQIVKEDKEENSPESQRSLPQDAEPNS